MSKTIEIRVTASQNQWLPYANQPPPSLAEIEHLWFVKLQNIFDNEFQ